LADAPLVLLVAVRAEGDVRLVVSAFMVAEAAIAYNCFAHEAVALFMMAGALFFVLDATFGFRDRPYPTLFSKAFFVGWNLIVIVTAYLVWKTGVFMLNNG